MLYEQIYNNYHIDWIYLNYQIVEIVVEYYQVQMLDCDQDRITYYPRDHDDKFSPAQLWLWKFDHFYLDDLITFLINFKFKDQIVKHN